MNKYEIADRVGHCSFWLRAAKQSLQRNDPTYEVMERLLRAEHYYDDLVAQV